MNGCGGCTLCCSLLEIKALNKPANTKCSQCVESTDCAIWQTRPKACRQFLCLWVTNPKFPKALRPDKCGVVFEPLKGRPVLLALTSPDRPYAWRNELPMAIIQMWVAAGTSVIATDGTTKHYHLPDGVREADVWKHVTSGMKEMKARSERTV